MSKIDREKVYNKYGGKCAYTGKPLGDDWQIDHVKPKCYKGENWDPNCYDNLLPALKIVNHYKRALDLKEFRYYMKTFHKRLAKVPKNPYTPRGIKRKAYMLEVAAAFDITPDKPFSGLFYFETLE